MVSRQLHLGQEVGWARLRSRKWLLLFYFGLIPLAGVAVLGTVLVADFQTGAKPEAIHATGAFCAFIGCISYFVAYTVFLRVAQLRRSLALTVFRVCVIFLAMAALVVREYFLLQCFEIVNTKLILLFSYVITNLIFLQTNSF